MAEEFEDDGVVVHVVEEGLRHLDRQVLLVTEGQGPLARVLDRLRRERLVVAVEETEYNVGRYLTLTQSY